MKNLTPQERQVMVDEIAILAAKYARSANDQSSAAKKRFYREMSTNFSVLATALNERQSFEAVA